MASAARAGSFCFYLHGHLPWVLSHGRWPHGSEWLAEAALGTYLPLIRSLLRLRDRGCTGGITLGVSPVLCEQLSHPDFTEDLTSYLEERIRTSGEEARTFGGRGDQALAALARHWEAFYLHTLEFFRDALGGDIIGALRDLEDSGALEIATCGATHGYFPLLGREESIALQVRLARRTHERHFGRAPRGIWLPEAAYRPAGPWRPPVGEGDERHRPGVESLLARGGLAYFLVDSALLLGGRAVGSYPDHFRDAPARTDGPAAERERTARDSRRSHWAGTAAGESPAVAFFTRDPRTALQVWSREQGYPGDPAYLEFHKKSDTGGQRYWKVTGSETDLGDKEIYRREEAEERARLQADHFHGLIREVLAGGGADSVLVAPFDAELFGHWWFEGIAWLENVLERAHRDPDLEATTLDRQLREHPPTEVVDLPEGSWGLGGTHHVWLNPEVDWTWRLIYPLEERTWELWRRAEASGNADARRVAVAAVRQLLVLSASDWQFLVTTGTAVDYATQRVHRHADDLERLLGICDTLLGGEYPGDADWNFVAEAEKRDDLFRDLDGVLAGLTESLPG
jgi:1,4-alpha-glucan branching enzyme